jgi:hypothetical protein
MKLRFYSTLQSFCDYLIADLQRTARHVQWLRVWAWTRATRENLAHCNERQTRRCRFC